MNHDTNSKGLLLLTTGHGARGTGLDIYISALRAAGQGERAARWERISAFRRDGGTLLPSGPAIPLRCGTDPIHKAKRRQTARRATLRPAEVRASIAAATEAGKEKGEALRADGISDAARAYIVRAERAEGDADAWQAMQAEADAAARVTPAERKANRKAKRAAKRTAPLQPRPVHCLTVSQGARGTAALQSVIAAERLSELAEQGAKRWARLWSASGGRELDAAALDELAALYHAAFARAAARCGQVPPDLRALYSVGCDGCGLTWRAWVAWRRALRLAGKACRSSMWAKGWELCDVVSNDALTRALAVMLGAPDERCHTVSSERTCMGEFLTAEDIAAEQAAIRPSAYLRRLASRWGDFVRVYWMLSGSRKWRSALASDLRLLATAVRIARGTGLECMPAEYMGGGVANVGALRQAVSQLRKRVAGGRLLATASETINAADAILEARAATRCKAPAREAVRVGDVVGSAQ